MPVRYNNLNISTMSGSQCVIEGPCCHLNVRIDLRFTANCADITLQNFFSNKRSVDTQTIWKHQFIPWGILENVGAAYIVDLLLGWVIINHHEIHSSLDLGYHPLTNEEILDVKNFIEAGLSVADPPNMRYLGHEIDPPLEDPHLTAKLACAFNRAHRISKGGKWDETIE